MRREVITLSMLILAGCLMHGCMTTTPKPAPADPPVESKKMDMDTRLSDLADQIAKSMSEQKKNKIAVVEFTDLRGNVTDFGRFLAEKLITKLFATGKFQVMERARLKKALEEQQFGLTGMVDDETAARLGKILGVEAIVIGTVTDLVTNVDVNSRLIGTETGTVFAVASTLFEKDETVTSLMRSGVTMDKAKDSSPYKTPTSIKTSAEEGIINSKQYFENEFLRITVKTLKRAGSKLTLELVYRNISNLNYKIGLARGKEHYYLVDDNGERWLLDGGQYTSQYGEADGIEIGLQESYNACMGCTDFPPDIKKAVKMRFYPVGDANGTNFTIVLDHIGKNSRGDHQNFQAVIRDIKTEQD